MENQDEKDADNQKDLTIANAELVKEMLITIGGKEPEMVEAILQLTNHIAGCYSDKYEKGIETIDTKKMLYGKGGALLNTYQVARYLQRYNTDGAEKSGLLKDILKAAHYLMFEITRRIRNGETDLKEPKH